MGIEELLDKNKFYCNRCLKENIITILERDPKDLEYLLPPKCDHINHRPFYKALWSKEKRKWILSQGLKIKAVTTDLIHNKIVAEGECSICGVYNKSRDQNGRGRDIGYNGGNWVAEKDIFNENQKLIVTKGDVCGCGCSKNFYIEHNNSNQIKEHAKEMGNQWRQSDEGKKFFINHNQSEKMRKVSGKILKKNTLPGNCTKCGMWVEKRSSSGFCVDCQKTIRHIEYCKKCGSATPHNGQKCLICYPEANGIKNMTTIIKIPIYCKKHGNVKFQFYDSNKKKYVCWECYKDKFEIEGLDIKSDFINKMQIDYPLTFIQKTYRLQNSIDWTGARVIFEYDLVNKGISWFSYIKFYIDKKNVVRPLVVGKTGTTLAKYDDGSNKRGDSDVCFSEWDPDDPDCKEGPARKFLYEINAFWDKTQILVIPCKTEAEAYKIEEQIIDKYNLFKS